MDIVGINTDDVALFCLSAWLFRRAAEQDVVVAVEGRDMTSQRRPAYLFEG